MWKDAVAGMLWSLGVLVLSLVLVAGVGCGGGVDYDGARRYPVEGKVTFDGNPIDWGSISFIPQGGDEQRVSGGTIENGTYLVPEEMGPNAGTYKVEIRWEKLTGRKVRSPGTDDFYDERKEGLPAKFHEKSTMTVDISDGNTKFDFDLKSSD